MTTTTRVLARSDGSQDLGGEVYEVVVGRPGEPDIHLVLLDAAAPQADSLRRRVNATVGHGPTRLPGGVLIWSVDPDGTPVPASTARPTP
jgi:hypothetical protein